MTVGDLFPDRLLHAVIVDGRIINKQLLVLLQSGVGDGNGAQQGFGVGVQRMEEQQKTVKAHKLVVNNRKTSMVTGVLDVLSFDLNEILLETEQGMLLVKGTDLHVNRLSVEKGEVDLSGTIDSVSYSNISQAKKQEESFWTKMFK